jgi:hypothetical protein
VKLFDSIRRALSRHDDRLAEEALAEDHTADPAAAETEYGAMRAGGLMGSRSDELEIESPEPEER